ncbi:MAG: hypothetical protein JXL67_13565, partial [Calditrichaeota bacterium]|nr:hypothetical protein [Calditrichota bacterium]
MTGIIICHHSLARELQDTAYGILGQKEDLFAFSNTKITTEDLIHQIRDLIEKQGNPEHIVFMVDIRGGNCWAVARLLSRSQPGYYVLSGVNLPMIFSFLTKRGET